MPEKTKSIWMDGKLVEWGKATTHVLVQGLHYGSAVFEGVRCYDTPNGSAVFRLEDHMQRFDQSIRIFGMNMPYSVKQMCGAVLETVKDNELKECYVRPLIFGGEGGFNLTHRKTPVHVIVAVWAWKDYLGQESVKKGVKAKVSSFIRPHQNSVMTKAKIAGNYVNSILAKQEAEDAGCEEAIMLDALGRVSEGSGENIFLVQNQIVYTPPKETILEGITRESVITVARDLGFEVREEHVTRDQLYGAEEVFFTGTAAEVVGVREIDGRNIGSGKRGPVTGKIQSAYADAVRGKTKKYESWLTWVK
ncbi:branched-chain amino acid transaminase [Candidatus Micrarchaeota archaeon]|nr:branched-chain amino acid transaminase [Candidatus Micrarchaeota archaeon]